jgi:hypothetical protein
MSSVVNTSEISSNLVPIRKKRGCHISVTRLAIEKADEIKVLRNELVNEKLQKNYYQIITAGLAVVLIATIFIINF